MEAVSALGMQLLCGDCTAASFLRAIHGSALPSAQRVSSGVHTCSISALHEQFPCLYVQDFFTDIVTAENFLSVSLGNLFANIDSNDDVDQALHARANHFRNYMQNKFRVKFDDPDDA